MFKYISLSALLCLSFQVKSQENQDSEKTYYTSRLQSDAPTIDGVLTDSAWDAVEWGGDFVGHRPEFRATPSQATQFKILYDAKFIYVAIRAFDSEPDKIAKRMSRRDGFEGDWVSFQVDSYHDQRTAFTFTASVSGVKGDEYVSNNGDDWDDTWDPLWYLKTSIDDKGWIAEFKIPLSQLRFADIEEQVWGLQFFRNVFRDGERHTWSAVDPTAQGWVHHYGELRGIKGIKPQKQLEVQPFVVGQLNTYEKETDDPYRNTGRNWDGNIGVDAKIGVTSNVTLDLTINPDFGQVEADPSTVNLSAFEQFFSERRPFFLEGSNIFSFRTSGGPNNLFYSRRVGAPAHGSVLAEDVSYQDRVPNTRILSAAKLTGKNAKGFSWGMMSTLTGDVNVKVTDSLGRERKEKIEPMTLYNMARFQQDIKGGQTVLGAIFTKVNRFGNSGNELEELHDGAMSAGFDLNHLFLDRKYGLTLQFSGTQVSGSEDAIAQTQQLNTRVFHRPDNDYRSLDTTRTVLSGTSSRFQFGKRAGNWRWEIGGNHRSPGFELNDIGFLESTDNINSWLWTQYRVIEVRGILRQQSYELNVERNWDFGGTPTYFGYGGNMRWEFNNFWWARLNIWHDASSISNADLRGGPSLKRPGGYALGFNVGSNERKKLSASFRPRLYINKDGAGQRIGWSGNISYRPSDAWQIALNPRFNKSTNDFQYVDVIEIEDENHYIMGQVDQKTYLMSLRVNYNISPNLTLEFWGQPFLAVGEYSDFKQITESTASEYTDRFLALGAKVRKPTDTEIATFVSNSDDYDSVDDFPSDVYGAFLNDEEGMDEILDPNFNTAQFRSNLVLRWEYIPGSTFFAVWSSNGSYFSNDDNNGFSQLSSDLLDVKGNNTFLIKYTYRFVR